MARADDELATVEGAGRTRAASPAETTADDLGSMASALGALAATPMPAGPLLRRGTLVDGMYRIEDAIGEGGMGVVYRARDLRLGRAVAIKVGTAVSSEALARVSREALALGRLSHPNVIVVYQVGELGGRLYIVMEYVAGGDARTWLGAAARTWREIVSLYAGAGDGLAAAHAAAMVHRDFKPDNVLVGDDGRARVGDFGLAVETGAPPEAVAGDEPLGPSGAITQTGCMLGTPAYMPPEQLAGDEVDARADQFAFCASVWEALFGARPFRGATPGELVDAITRGDVRPPGRADVPPHVIAALRRGLAADRDARWPSMEPLLVELRRDVRKRRRRVIAIAGAAAAAIGFGLFYETRDRAIVPDAPVADAPVAPDPGGVVTLAYALGDAGYGNVEGIVELPGGDVLVAGHFDPPFAPRGIPISGCAAGRRCSFVLRLSQQAEVRWVRVIGGDDIRLHGPAVAGDRAVVVADIRVPGGLAGVPGADQGEGAFALDIDVRSGAIRWFRRLASVQATARAVVLDSAGNAYVSGEVHGGFAFDHGWRPAAGPATGASGYLESLAPDGTIRWGLALPGGDEPRFMGVAVSGDTVWWAGSATEPSSPFQHTVIASVDAARGSVRWIRRLPGGASNQACALAAAPDGGVVVGGYFRTTVDFGDDHRGATLESAGEIDGYVAELDGATGATRWAHAVGGGGWENLTAIAIAPDGDLWVVGRSDGLVGPPAHEHPDVLVMRLAPDGTTRWTGTYGGHEQAKAKAVSVGASGVWVAGSFTHLLHAGRFTLTGNARMNPMVLRLDPARAR